MLKHLEVRAIECQFEQYLLQVELHGMYQRYYEDALQQRTSPIPTVQATPKQSFSAPSLSISKISST